jgi:hypothetical protein
MQDLKQLHAVKIKLKTQTLTLRTELKGGASLAFKSIGLKIPNRILQNQSPQM